MKKTPLRRRKGLARGTKPLKRSGRLKGRKVPKAFRHRRDPAYAAWVRQLPCLLAGRTWQSYGKSRERHHCWLPVQVCHVRSRGAGGDDDGNVVPMCGVAHASQHSIGRRSFETRWQLDLKAEAERLYQLYVQEQD